MSKIKDAVIRAQEVKQHYYYNYMDALYENMPKQPLLTEEDIEYMEKSYGHSSNPTFVNASASVPSSALNNHNYNNIKRNRYAN